MKTNEIEEIKKLLDYNLDTGIFTWKVSTSNRVKKGSIAGNKNIQGYIYIRVKNMKTTAHRLAWMFCYGEIKDQIDHKNGNRSDNRIINLRECTHSQNLRNTPVRKNNKLGVKGVCLSCNKKRYVARIRVGRIRISLGTYDTLTEASDVYKEAAKILHGEFAYKEKK